MKNLAHFATLLAGALPALSFIIPDERVVNQAFRYQGRVESDSSQLEEFRKKFENLEDSLEDKLSDIIDKAEKLDESFSVGEDTATDSGAAALDDGFDAFYGLKEEHPFPDTYEYFDGQAWMSQSTDSLLASFPYEDFISDEHHDHDHDHGHHGHHGHHDHDHHGHCKHPRLPHDPHDHTDSTLFDIISKSKHTTKLAELIKEDDDLVNLLKDPNANITIFAPGDEAFKRLPKKDPKDVPKDLLEHVLTYHIAEGIHDAHDLIYHNTLITKLGDDALGKGIHQRVKIGLGFHGPALNYYSRLTIVDIVRTGVYSIFTNTVLTSPIN